MDRAPNRCHIGTFATVFATGIEVPFVTGSSVLFGEVFVWCSFLRWIGRFGKGDLRKAVRLAALIAKTDILKSCYCSVMLLTSFRGLEIFLFALSEADLRLETGRSGAG